MTSESVILLCQECRLTTVNHYLQLAAAIYFVGASAFGSKHGPAPHH